MGRELIEEDVRRIKLAFEVAGKERRVMVDANQVFNRNEALRRGRVYQEMGCFWYEEPLPPQDMEGYAELAHALDIRIATGENLATKYAFAELIAPRGADVVQPDSQRHGMDGDRGHRRWLRAGTGQPRRQCDQSQHAAGHAERHLHGVGRRAPARQQRNAGARGTRHEQRTKGLTRCRAETSPFGTPIAALHDIDALQPPFSTT